MRILLMGASGVVGSALSNHLSFAKYQLCLRLRLLFNLNRLNNSTRESVVVRRTKDIEVDAFVAPAEPEVLIHTPYAFGRQCESLSQNFDANLRFGLVTLQAFLRTEQSATFINMGFRLLFVGNLIRQTYMLGANYRISGYFTNAEKVMNNTFWINVHSTPTKITLDSAGSRFQHLLGANF